MTKNEFMKKYGETKVKFDNYYKGVFTFTNEEDDGTYIEVRIGRDGEEVYKFLIDTYSAYVAWELNPYAGIAYINGNVVNSFYEELKEEYCGVKDQVVVSCGSEQAAKALADFDFDSLADIMMSTHYGEDFGYDVDDDFYEVKDNLIDRAYRVVSEVVENPDSCISTGGFSAFINEAGILELSFTLAHSVG